ncbi:MAG: hypothetical protein ACOC2U_03680 [bacterium]
MSKDVKFDREFLNLVQNLTKINSSILFERSDDNGVIIKRKNPAGSIAYILSASEDSFDFDEEEIAFYNFPEFAQMLSVFKSPNIKQDENRLVISENKSKIKYVVTDPEIISRGPNKVNFGDADATMVIDRDLLKEIRSMIGILDSENIKLKISDNNITVVCYNSNHDNQWENTYDIENSLGKDFELTIKSEVFVHIPDGNYKMELKEAGIVKFAYQSDIVNLDIFVAEVEG